MEAQEIAIEIVRKLRGAGYTAYFAGGWVRDFIMGRPSQDIDIATDASPETIINMFANTTHVGIVFGVVIVTIQGHMFEVATFRKDLDYRGGRRPTGIEKATPEEDAMRRDFTINGMFYDPLSEKILDYVGGQRDIERGVISTIGDPYERFEEDRLRMIRAVRFSARFNFHMDLGTQKAIQKYSPTLFPAVSMERVFHEFQKMSESDNFADAVADLHHLGLLETIFPELKGRHLSEVKKQVEPFTHYPKNAPTMSYLIRLFPDANSDKIEDLCRYLRVSIKEMDFVMFMKKCEKMIEGDLCDWARIYADIRSEMVFEILGTSDQHVNRRLRLKWAIKRIREKKPVVSATHLKKLGVKPSKQMGILLAEAEKIAINGESEDSEYIIAELKESHAWNQ